MQALADNGLIIDDRELARRSIRGFGEMVAALGRGGLGTAAEVRQLDAVGACIPAALDNHWFDAVIVPVDAAPPSDDPGLPHCLWTVAEAVPGRVEEPSLATPCLGLTLNNLDLEVAGELPQVEAPSLSVLGEVNERA